MHVITHRRLREFARRHPAARGPVEAWYREARVARWKGPGDVKGPFPRASILNGVRIVFDLGGNKFRLVVKVRWATERSRGTVFVRFIGTHREYDRIDAGKI